jgi:sodium-dependent dicarboxylate transporter 2/3/5
MWISNTATVAMMLPIGLSLLAVLERHGGRASPRYGTVLLLSTSFAASIGGLGTPVGTPPNLIGLGFIRRETTLDLPFFTWMTLGVPVVVLTFAPWTTGQRNSALAFGVTVALWVFPGLVALAAGQQHPLYQRLTAVVPESVAALAGATLLFVLPTDVRRHEFTLPWDEAVKIDWWIVFLYGGGMALGALAFRTGLAETLGRGLTDALGVKSAFGLLALSTALATVLSETTSNTASANMVVPVVIACARAAGVDPVLPAIGATMGASLGFMLPVSTPCNAIVYASGRIPLPTMIRHGLALDLIGVVGIVVVLSLLGPLVVR